MGAKHCHQLNVKGDFGPACRVFSANFMNKGEMKQIIGVYNLANCLASWICLILFLKMEMINTDILCQPLHWRTKMLKVLPLNFFKLAFNHHINISEPRYVLKCAKCELLICCQFLTIFKVKLWSSPVELKYISENVSLD